MKIEESKTKAQQALLVDPRELSDAASGADGAEEEVKLLRKALAERDSWIVNLQTENARLRDLVGDYNHAVDMIVDKHHDKVGELADERRQESRLMSEALLSERVGTEALQAENFELKSQLEALLGAMKEAAARDEAELAEQSRITQQLAAENAGLRVMMGIGSDEEVDLGEEGDED